MIDPGTIILTTDRHTALLLTATGGDQMLGKDNRAILSPKIVASWHIMRKLYFLRLI